MQGKDVKRFVLVSLVLLAGLGVLFATPVQSGRSGDSSQLIVPLKDVELLCLWTDQYQAGLITREEFKTLLVGRIVIIIREYYLQRLRESGRWKYTDTKIRSHLDFGGE
jgi:hypothetical protein